MNSRGNQAKSVSTKSVAGQISSTETSINRRELKGVFTLGEKQADTLARIASAKTALDESTKRAENLTQTLTGCRW